jgi:hypothetical protein
MRKRCARMPNKMEFFCAPTPIMTRKRWPMFTKHSGWSKTCSARPRASWIHDLFTINALRRSGDMWFAHFWPCV